LHSGGYFASDMPSARRAKAAGLTHLYIDSIEDESFADIDKDNCSDDEKRLRRMLVAARNDDDVDEEHFNAILMDLWSYKVFDLSGLQAKDVGLDKFHFRSFENEERRPLLTPLVPTTVIKSPPKPCYRASPGST
jgi:hypothetical protein